MADEKDIKVEKEVTPKKEVKKLDDVKDSAENKAALAAHAGVPSEDGKAEGASAVGSEQLAVSSGKGKVESKPAVAKESKKKDKGVVVELEREYVVPLRKGFLKTPKYKRAKKAVRVLKEFIVQHMNVRDGDLKKVKIDQFLNNELWFRGIKKPASKIKVKAKKVDGIVYVELAEIPEAVGFKMAWATKVKALAVGSKQLAVGSKKKAKDDKDDDKDGDGVSDAKEEKEDARSGAEMNAKTEKKMAKDAQHTATGVHKKNTSPVRVIPRNVK